MATNPTLLTQPIATNGTKNAIPNTTTTPGKMSQDQGFPSETSLPLGAGGVAPSREDFNGVFNLLSALLYYAQKGFTFNYDNTQNYYTGCVVIDPTDGKRYECIADMAAGTIAPSDDTAGDYWKEYGNTSSLANKDLSNLTETGENHFLEQDYMIIYPNGGTAANPSNVATNSRYIEANPFPGYAVKCVAEVFFDNQWGNPEWFSAWNSANQMYAGGVKANQLDDDAIIIQTCGGENASYDHLVWAGPQSGAPWNTSSAAGAPLPCRVKVWKIGKLVNNE